MIGSVTVKAGGANHTLRLSTRAMLSLERGHNKSIMDVLKGMEDEGRVGQITELFAVCMNDGKGATEDEALDLIDEIGGLAKAGDVLGEVVEQAFPDDGDGGDGAPGSGDAPKPKAGASSGNGKPAREK